MTGFLKQMTGLYEYMKGIHQNMTAFLKNIKELYDYMKGIYKNMTGFHKLDCSIAAVRHIPQTALATHNQSLREEPSSQPRRYNTTMTFVPSMIIK